MLRTTVGILGVFCAAVVMKATTPDVSVAARRYGATKRFVLAKAATKGMTSAKVAIRKDSGCV